MVQEEKSFYISKLELWWLSCSAERNYFGYMCMIRGHYEEHSVKLFWIWTSGSGGNVVFGISHLELRRTSCLSKQTVWAILAKVIIRDISVKLFWICTSGWGGGGFRFKIFLSRAHAAVLLCGSGNFDRGHYEEYFCEIILKCRLRFSYLELWRPPKWEDRNHVGNFGRGHYEKHFYVIILI